jgi:hypothetical protein
VAERHLERTPLLEVDLEFFEFLEFEGFEEFAGNWERLVKRAIVEWLEKRVLMGN